jgi:tetratricopeptide (TPR) repeat protein
VPGTLLEHLWQAPEGCAPHLEALTRLEFFYAQPGDAEPVYAFRHALTQEVAYDSLAAPQRQSLHAAAARALETRYAERLEELAERLAYHYARTAEAAKAVEFLQQAMAHAERLPAAEQDRCLLELSLRLAFSWSVLGRFQEILALLQRQRERLERVRDPLLVGPYWFRLGMTHNDVRDYAQATHCAQAAIAAAQQAGDAVTMGQAYYLLALNDHWSDRTQQGIEHARQAIALLDGTPEWHWLGLAYWILGWQLGTVGAFQAALDAEARVEAIGRASGDPRLQSFAASCIGVIHATRGDWEEGIAACRRALACARDPISTVAARCYLGYAHLEKGEDAEAIALLERAVQHLGQLRLRQTQSRAAAWLGGAYLGHGRMEQARQMARWGLDLGREVQYGLGIAWAQRVLGRIAQASGDLAAARRHLEAALQSFAAIQARFEVGRTHLALAELARVEGRSAALQAHLTAAAGLFQDLEVPRYAARAAELAQALAVPPG